MLTAHTADIITWLPLTIGEIAEHVNHHEEPAHYSKRGDDGNPVRILRLLARQTFSTADALSLWA